ncbi:MAG: alpha/beta hydrolase [Cyclobacteriaceae bacterium]|nr:alpha/beta hydrolase [Cyclobacteriaceae bacterium]MCH8515098.1 alpha/beta hydrolase [Cyclobacteriaceae bacterium]
MATISINGVDIHYLKRGIGSETIVFSHGLLWSHKMFREQMDHFAHGYQVLGYDHRGQGQSEVVSTGYDMDIMTLDALQLIKQVVGEPVHFVGLSMGGFIGMRLAARYPDWVKSLTLIETSAQAEAKENIGKYKTLSTMLKIFGMPFVSKSVMKIMFGETFLNDPSRTKEKEYWEKELKSNAKSITKSVNGVINRHGVEHELKRIQCPTLIIVGSEDVATTPEKSIFMHENIKGSKLVTIDEAGHSSTIEQPKKINQALQAFYEEIKNVTAADEKIQNAGL